MSREALLARTLVELADTLVDDFDVVELLTLLTDRCVEVLDVAAAGLMLGYPGGDLRVMASSSHAMRLLELFELQSAEGPCPDCYRSGEPIVNHRLDPSGGRWPRFGPMAVEAGFRSVHALPMRLRDVTIGALNLFRTDEGGLNDADVLAAQALADVATIAVLHHRSARDTQLVNEQLHHALNSRIVIEQAKGMVAERAGLDMDGAFSALRDHARSHNLRLVGVAHDIIDGALPPASLQAAAPLLPARRVAEARQPLADVLAALGGTAPVLDMVEAAAPVDAVAVVAADLAVTLDGEEVSFLIADRSGDSLIRFVSAGRGGRPRPGTPEKLEEVPIAGTPFERALRCQEVQVVAERGRHRLFAPVADRGDALGVLELVVGQRPDSALVEKVASAAHAMAYAVIASRQYTDVFERVQRDVPFSLAAEIQHRLMPRALTCEADQFTFAGWLEPASHVGGDTFDYSVDRDALHVSMTDAMGRGVKAALLATLALGSLRNSRHAGMGLAEQAQRANDAMASNANDDQFVTGLLLQVDLGSGRVVAVNAGHPHPYRLRAGKVDRLQLDADIPFGMIGGSLYREQELHLEPGDRLVVVTDGLLERNEAAGHLDVAAAIGDTATLHPREVVHAFKASVLAAARAELDDDAAVVCIDWHGSRPLDAGALKVAGPRDATDAA
ncbi:MAG TPA: SpoIIE family protein phosphatase [Acidimicrobiales bacterium]|nr:SpoIIE family protein phosphatase [Acidimicrobiales bacterium]